MMPLENLLREKAPLTLFDFMKTALFHEDYGYYRTQNPIGEGGDFTTAPEVSQMFGEMIAFWILNIWEQLGCPPILRWIELGPGRGTLLKDALRILRQVPACHTAVHFSLVEINPTFEAAQRDILQEFPSTQWFPSWQACFVDLEKDSTPIVLIANEFLDVFPIHQYTYQNPMWYERYVVLKGDKLTFEDRLLETPPSGWEGKDLKNGIYEIAPEAQAFVTALTHLFAHQRGASLLIDYGYESNQGDSFQALHKGASVSPFSHIGMSDLTAHVDFGCLKDLAPHAHGPVSQGDFLHHLGIQSWKEKLRQGAVLSQKATLEAQYHRLTHPLQMGHLFKVMSISSSNLHPLGF